MKIAALRMANLRLWGEPFPSIHDVVLGLGAIQAQEFHYAKWSVAQRCAGGVTEAEVDRAVADGTLLRLHLLRPTWHFVSPKDIRWLLDLTGPRVNAVNAHYYRMHGVEDFGRTNAILGEALAGGVQLDRREMREVLLRHGLELSNLAFGFVLMRAELDGVICSGAPRGKQQTYALIDERAPGAVRLERDEALAEIALRYFGTRGPATLKDFAWWSGLTQADGRRGIDLADGRIESQVVNGRTYWLTRSTAVPPELSPRVDLVQIYDEVGMSYTESRDALMGEGIQREEPRYYHTILLDGRLAGHWRRAAKGRGFDIQLLRKLNRAETAALESAKERYLGFASA